MKRAWDLAAVPLAAGALAAGAGVSLGLGSVVVAERLRLEAGPPEWDIVWPDIPVLLESLAGPPRFPGEGWPLSSRGVLQHSRTDARRIEAVVDVPPEGMVGVGLQTGAELWILEARGSGARVVQARTDLPPEAIRSAQAAACAELAVDLTDGPVRMAAELTDEGLVVQVGEARDICPQLKGVGQPTIRAGLQRIGIHSVSVDGAPALAAPGPALGARVLGALVGGLLAMGVVLAPLPGRRTARALTLAPLLLCAPLALADLSGWQQGARLLFAEPLWLALVLPGLLAGAAVAARLGARFLSRETPLPRWAAPAAGAVLGLLGPPAVGVAGLAAVPVGALGALLAESGARLLGPGANPRAAAVVGAAFALLSGLVALALQPTFGVSVLLATGIGAGLALVLWANVRASAVRAFNLLSLLGVLVATVSAEQALTWSATGQRLVGVSSRVEQVHNVRPSPNDPFADFLQIDGQRTHSAYPSSGYPTAPPPRDAPVRIIALGSSATGGAWMFDDLDAFWPATLDRQLGAGVQVVNQGVGGWTTLHIRRYVETRIDDLDADILVVYQGNNDLRQVSPRPYAELYAAQQGRQRRLEGPLRWLRTVRLYQLLRGSLSGLTTQRSDSAVPLPDARRNLQAIVTTATSHDARVLLVTEALFSDPGLLADYAAMMRDIARGRDDVAAMDAAAVLSGSSAWENFEDDVHPSRVGHRRLGEAVADELRALGWVPAD